MRRCSEEQDLPLAGLLPLTPPRVSNRLTLAFRGDHAVAVALSRPLATGYTTVA
jgi:hypothetical protein